MEATLEYFLENLYLTNQAIPHHLTRVNNEDTVPQMITLPELNRIINNIKRNKAPGHDFIDYNLVKRIYKVAPQLLLSLFNACLKFNHFPSTYKHGKVILFHKKNKDPQLPSSYRPICLLPAIGKILERIIHGRINHHFYKNDYWNKNQFGFKYNTSTEHALNHLINNIKKDKKLKRQTLLISLDVSGAFDSIRWPLVINLLKKSPCPPYLINWMISFLEDRAISIEENQIKITKKMYGGCPQGSCLGPLLWLIIADSALNYNWGENIQVQAFADDFMIKVSADTEESLKQQANESLRKFHIWTTECNLTLNWTKTQILHLNRPRTTNLPQADSSTITNIKFKSQVIPLQEKIKYLGVILDKNLDWHEHCLYRISRVHETFRTLGTMTRRGWGINPGTLKVWYSTVVEKILTYAAPIWGQKLQKRTIDKLLSCQRHFALAITKAYRTAPTNALLILSGLIPIHIQINYEATYGTISRLKQTTSIFGKTFNHNDYVSKFQIWQNHPANLVEPTIGYNDKDIVIYTDGSKLESAATGSAYVAYKNTKIISTWSMPLRKCNSIFQAELLAILKASEWGNTTGHSYSIRSDCLSAINSLFKPFNNNQLVQEILNNVANSQNKFKISWVKAHAGTEGNEKADELAKKIANNENKEYYYYLRKPTSELKRNLKIAALERWQEEWDYGDTGRTTHKFFPKVKKSRLIGCKYLAQIYTGHGAFPSYLNRFKRKESPQCSCGELGTPIHYLTSCPLTSPNHLAPITFANEQIWYKQLANNKHVQQKGRKVIDWLISKIDDISN